MVVLGNLDGRLKSQGRYLAYPRYGSAAHHHTIGNWLTTLCHVAGVPQDHFGQPDLALGESDNNSGRLKNWYSDFANYRAMRSVGDPIVVALRWRDITHWRQERPKAIVWLVDVDEFDDEMKVRMRRDRAWGTSFAVSES